MLFLRTDNFNSDNMKKWFWAGAAVAVLVIAVVVAVNIEYEKPVSQEKLPAAAQSFLEQYYPGGNIALVMKSLDDMKVTYETIYTDGVRVEFDRRGEWKKVGSGLSPVPQDLIPPQITAYLSANFPALDVVKIERDRKEWEVKLSNRMELTFDSRTFALTDVDD